MMMKNYKVVVKFDNTVENIVKCWAKDEAHAKEIARDSLEIYWLNKIISITVEEVK